MHHSTAEPIPILAHNVEEVFSGVAVVQVKGKPVFLGQVEMVGEHCKLLLLRGIVEAVIVKAALPDSHQTVLNDRAVLIHLHKVVFY